MKKDLGKIPYGLDMKEIFNNDEPWLKLKTIMEYLHDCESVPPNLARWLGEAIRKSHENKDANKFLTELGLKKKRGKQKKYNEETEFWLGKKICDLELRGFRPEEAITHVQEEANKKEGEEIPRTVLQEFRDSYKEVLRIERETE